jgi:hypothetical protein
MAIKTPAEFHIILPGLFLFVIKNLNRRLIKLLCTWCMVIAMIVII